MKKLFEKMVEVWCNWWFLIIIIIVVVFGLIYEKSIEDNNYDKPIPYSSLTENEKKDSKIEALEEENTKLKEELSNTAGELEELKIEHKNAEDLIELLRNQLEEHGIQPYEL